MKKIFLFIPFIVLSAGCASTAPVVVENDNDSSTETKIITADTTCQADPCPDESVDSENDVIRAGVASTVIRERNQPKAFSDITDEGIVSRVIDSMIQRNRVVIILDAGSELGVYRGMKGVLANGRYFTVVSVDFKTSRAVIVGLNVRIANGASAVLRW